MKHNEVKAYFKNKLKEKLKDYDILSVDQTLSSRTIYVVAKETLKVILVLDCWFGTDEYSVTGFNITDEHRNLNKKIHKFVDKDIEIKGNYTQLHYLKNLIDTVVYNLTDPGKKK